MLRKIIFDNVEDAKKLLEEEYGLNMEGHTNDIWSLAITCDNKYIISSGANSDNSIRV